MHLTFYEKIQIQKLLCDGVAPKTDFVLFVYLTFYEKNTNTQLILRKSGSQRLSIFYLSICLSTTKTPKYENCFAREWRPKTDWRGIISRSARQREEEDEGIVALE